MFAAVAVVVDDDGGVVVDVVINFFAFLSEFAFECEALRVVEEEEEEEEMVDFATGSRGMKSVID